MNWFLTNWILILVPVFVGAIILRRHPEYLKNVGGMISHIPISKIPWKSIIAIGSVILLGFWFFSYFDSYMARSEVMATAAAPPAVVDGASLIIRYVKLPNTSGYDPNDRTLKTWSGTLIDFDGDEFDFDMYSQTDGGTSLITRFRGNRTSTRETWEGDWTLNDRRDDKCGQTSGRWWLDKVGRSSRFLGKLYETVWSDDCREKTDEEWYLLEVELE